MSENQQIIENVMIYFNGRNPFEIAKKRLKQMSKDEVEKLFLVSCNRMGTLTKGGEYKDKFDAMVHLGTAIENAFLAFDNAQINSQSTVFDLNETKH